MLVQFLYFLLHLNYSRVSIFHLVSLWHINLDSEETKNDGEQKNFKNKKIQKKLGNVNTSRIELQERQSWPGVREDPKKSTARQERLELRG